MILLNQLKKKEKQSKPLNAESYNTNIAAKLRIEAQSHSQMGYGCRKFECQDSYCEISYIQNIAQFYAIFDGYGRTGKEASQATNYYLQTYIEKQFRYLRNPDDPKEIQLFLKSAFEFAEKSLKSSGMDYSESGTCAICVLIIKNLCYVVNVGNSKAILYMETDKERIAYELSYDHRLTRPDERNRILKSQGKIHKVLYNGHPDEQDRLWKDEKGPGITATRSLGQQDSQRFGLISTIEITTYLLGFQDKFIVLGSDGLWDQMNSAEVCEFIRSNELRRDYIAFDLIDACREKWKRQVQSNEPIFPVGDSPNIPIGCDDITVMVLYLTFDENESYYAYYPLPITPFYKKLINPVIDFYDKIISKKQQVLNKFKKQFIKEKPYVFDPNRIETINIAAYCLNDTSNDQNKDSYMYAQKITQDSYILGICDGFGVSGQKIAQKILECVENYGQSQQQFMKSCKDQKKIINLMKNMFLHINQQLKNLSQDCSESGATALVVLIHDNICYVANVGNNRAVLFRETDKEFLPIELSKDQTVKRKEERQRIEKKGGKMHPIVIDGQQFGPQRIWSKEDKGPGITSTRAFGSQNLQKIGIICEPEIFSFKITKQDKFIVLGSDGIWNAMSNAEACQFINNCEGDIYQVAKLFIKKCLEIQKQKIENQQNEYLVEDEPSQKNGCDDTTALIGFFAYEVESKETGSEY